MDGAKNEIARSSQKYQFTGEVEKREASMSRDVLFFRTPELPAGRHTLEAVVHDGIAEKSTVLRIPIDVAATGSPLVVGDLIVASRVEPFPADQPGAAEHPLVWKGVLFYPSFGEPLSQAKQAEMTFALPHGHQGRACRDAGTAARRQDARDAAAAGRGAGVQTAG